MDALVMAGGKGERMGNVEKPMAKLGGKPLLAYVLKALLGSRSIGRAYVAVSPNVPLTIDYVKGCPGERVAMVMTPGSGYVEDMAYAVRMLGLYEPFLVISADLPFIRPDVIDVVASAYGQCGKEALSVRVDARQAYGEPAMILTDSGAPTVSAGINVVHGARMDRAQEEHVLVLNDPMLTINVNYRKDLTLCTQLLAKMRETER